MKKKKRDFDIFSLSFLDIISCGFGAIVLLVLISNNAEAPSADDRALTGSLLKQVFELETSIEALGAEIDAAGAAERDKELLLARLKEMAEAAAESTRASESAIEEASADMDGLALVKTTLNRATISQDTADVRDTEVGGIPVDSDYVVFIADTSGSMKEIWNRVVSEVENILEIHPRVKGFQILNDNGLHLISAYKGKWIPDTKRRRNNVIDLFRSWNSASNSSPVEGLEVALKQYAKPGNSLSIYILGDDYTGSSYDPVINTLMHLNTNRVSGERLAKVHAIGFMSQYTTARFAILMREVTRKNGGSFVALPR